MRNVKRTIRNLGKLIDNVDAIDYGMPDEEDVERLGQAIFDIALVYKRGLEDTLQQFIEAIESARNNVSSVKVLTSVDLGRELIYLDALFYIPIGLQKDLSAVIEDAAYIIDDYIDSTL